MVIMVLIHQVINLLVLFMEETPQVLVTLLQVINKTVLQTITVDLIIVSPRAIL